ncbi:Uma2 family endonuclease [Nocardiopsis sp. EMB25]|uniref:Uma2 family endonuclease n=1 Tax=Nocardiopsis sp. EMB25 TaxID=2835867 RepID=UPI00228401C6|nr:Uma2 family endonuclease [Nocardiopsis sp. EMB25]MCY9783564.1 Uma2 family endonuclease [Nocardiopsis sp. EMB25]
MSLMTTGKTDLDPAPLTVEDLKRMPDDGQRYELVDGRLDVSPAPVFAHSRVESRLTIHLGVIAPPEFEVVSTPGINVNADRTHHRVPDLAVIRADAEESPYLTKPPLLAVEIVSPESAIRDHHTKRQEYEEFGIPSYWIVNPDPALPSITELRLEDGGYREVTTVVGENVLKTDTPFPLSVVPHWLVALGNRRKHVGGSDEAAG